MPLARLHVLPPDIESVLAYTPGCAVPPVHPLWLGRPLVDGAVRLLYGSATAGEYDVVVGQLVPPP